MRFQHLNLEEYIQSTTSSRYTGLDIITLIIKGKITYNLIEVIIETVTHAWGRVKNAIRK